MERKTKVLAEDDQQSILITREFDLPVDLLFKAHTDAEIFEQWMTHEYAATKVQKLEVRNHGSWQFESRDSKGNIVFKANGTIHQVVPNKKIVRTFEMNDATFDVQLEFLEFESLSEDTSKLSMHIIYRTPELRNEMLKLPFEYGLNMAHNRLQEVIGKLK